MADQGRNEMCRCGSGKKYKKCCGRVTQEIPDKLSAYASAKQNEVVGCEFCGAPSTRMFKAPRKPIILSLAGRTFKAIKPYWLACSFCATSIETNNLDAVIQRGKEAVIAMYAALNLPRFADKKEELKQEILKMSFKLLGLETIRKALELPSKPIDKPMVAAGNRAITAVLAALKDATGSTEHAAAMFESLESAEPNWTTEPNILVLNPRTK